MIFTSNVIVLACWTALDPLRYQRLVGEGNDFWNREIESYGACRSDKALGFLIPLALINFATLGVACWQVRPPNNMVMDVAIFIKVLIFSLFSQAFEARDIQSAFSEATYTGYSVASLFQAFLTGFPIVVLVKDDPRAFYLVLTFMIFVLLEGILLLIFLPKMILAYQYSKLSKAEQKKMLADQIALSSGQLKNSSGKPIDAESSAFSRMMKEQANQGDEVKRNGQPQDEAVQAEPNDSGNSGSNRDGLGKEGNVKRLDRAVVIPTRNYSIMSTSTIEA